MTAIAALLSTKGIAVASDSLIIVRDALGGHAQIETRKPKIIPVRNIHACISYWGFAGIPEGNKKLKWSFYDWLKKEFSHTRFNNLADFSNDVRDKLDGLFSLLGVSRSDRG